MSAWQRLQATFDVTTGTANLGPHQLVLPELRDPVPYIEARMAQGGSDDLPYWTRVWPGAVALASFVASRADSMGRVLELGAGLGVPGLVAASCGRSVLLSDFEPDALAFARAAVELNGMQDRVNVIELDWTAPPTDIGVFDTVLGSEILYRPALYPSLIQLLDRVLAPDGRAYISHEERPFHIGFFDDAASRFVTRTTSCKVTSKKSEGGKAKIYLHALQRV